MTMRKAQNRTETTTTGVAPTGLRKRFAQATHLQLPIPSRALSMIGIPGCNSIRDCAARQAHPIARFGKRRHSCGETAAILSRGAS